MKSQLKFYSKNVLGNGVGVICGEDRGLTLTRGSLSKEPLIMKATPQEGKGNSKWEGEQECPDTKQLDRDEGPRKGQFGACAEG